MLDSWNLSIFSNIKNRLQDSAMKLVHAERNGEAFDSQLVTGVRESYGAIILHITLSLKHQLISFVSDFLCAVNLCSNSEDKLTIYMENFEKAYIDSTESFYKLKAPQYLEVNGVQNYMRYAESKLREEEQRANKYLENCSIATVVFKNSDEPLLHF